MEAALEIMGDFKKSGYRDAELKAALTKASLVNRDQRLTPKENTSESMPNSEHCNCRYNSTEQTHPQPDKSGN